MRITIQLTVPDGLPDALTAALEAAEALAARLGIDPAAAALVAYTADVTPAYTRAPDVSPNAP